MGTLPSRARFLHYSSSAVIVHSININDMVTFTFIACIFILAIAVACIRCHGGRDQPSPANGGLNEMRRPRHPANRGLNERALNSLPKLTFTPAASASDQHKLEDCAICLAEFEEGEEIRVLPHCGHGYHVICIDAWLASHSTCPSCRQMCRWSSSGGGGGKSSDASMA